MKSRATRTAATKSATAGVTRRDSMRNAKERQINDDYEWCLHDPEVQKQYGGKVVVAYRKRIIGAGKNHTEAWRTAQRTSECPGNDSVAFVYVPEGTA